MRLFCFYLVATLAGFAFANHAAQSLATDLEKLQQARLEALSVHFH